MARPSASTTPVSVTSATPTPVSTATPCATSSAATSTASSGSSGVSTWSAASTTVVRMPQVGQVLGRLEPDEPGADDDGRARRAPGLVGQQLGVLDGAQDADPVEPGQRGPDGRRAGAEDQRVVGELGRRTVPGGAHRDGVRGRVDGDHLGAHPHVEAEPVEEALGGLQQEVVLVLDHAADEVREAAVGVGHVARALEHDDRRLLVEAAEPGGGRHPPGHPADDHDPARAHGQASFMNMRWTSSSG